MRDIKVLAAVGLVIAVSLAASAASAAPSTGDAEDAKCKACTLENCPLITDADLRCWADKNYYAGRTCHQCISKASRQLKQAEKDLIVTLYKDNDPDAQCVEPSILVQGALRSSVLVTRGGRGLGGNEHAVQLMPTFSIGIPLPISEENDATKALNGSVTFGGIVLRYTPMSYWVSLNLLVGTAEPSSISKLDAEIYTSPKLLSYGYGISIMGNIVNVNLLWTDLRGDGLFSQKRATAQYINVGIDFSALAFVAVGATR